MSQVRDPLPLTEAELPFLDIHGPRFADDPRGASLTPRGVAS